MGHEISKPVKDDIYYGITYLPYSVPLVLEIKCLNDLIPTFVSVKYLNSKQSENWYLEKNHLYGVGKTNYYKNLQLYQTVEYPDSTIHQKIDCILSVNECPELAIGDHITLEMFNKAKDQVRRSAIVQSASIPVQLKFENGEVMFLKYPILYQAIEKEFINKDGPYKVYFYTDPYALVNGLYVESK